MEREKELQVKTKVHVNALIEERCSPKCQHVMKVKSLYTCTLYDEIVDHGDDDEFGYDFQRTKECRENEL